jgi:phospholipid/cholesterol/gamma-HCH transport system substrate-binding protein
VGRVGAMSLTQNAVKIEMIINSKWKIPRDGTRARVLFKSAVGEQFIDLLPEQAGGPTFHAGDVIPQSMTSIPVQTEDLLRELFGVLSSIDPAKLGTAIHELGQGLSGHGADLRDTIKALDELAVVGAQHRNEIAGLLGNGADLQDSFNTSSKDFTDAIASLRTVLQTTAGRTSNLTSTLQSTRVLNADLIDLLHGRDSQIKTVVHDLGTVTRISHQHLEDIDMVLTYLGPFFRDVSAAYDAPYFIFNNTGNPEPLQCSYDRSGHPLLPVTQTTNADPKVNFSCTGISESKAASAVKARLEMERLSWLHLYTLGY